MTSEKVPSTNSGLFDQFGRCIPSVTKSAVHNKTRRYFQIVQPEIDLDKIYDRFAKYFAIDSQISRDNFKLRAQAITDSLSSQDTVKDIIKGVAVPFILPKADYGDIGDAIESTYMKVIAQTYAEVFPNYEFVNHCPASLEGKLDIVGGSRHEKLITAMRQGPVVGYYFPCLLEYSIPAAIEQVSKMPEQFLLAAGFDTAAAFIAAPDLLMRNDGYPPLLWLSGLCGEAEDVNYHFEAYGYNLTFNRRHHFDQVAEYWASGLTVIG